MLPIIPKPPITPRQKGVALAVAGAIDLIQIVFFPLFGVIEPFEVALDVVAAAILVAVCGFKWQFAAAFTLELFPLVDIFPTWTAVVLTLPSAARTPGMPEQTAPTMASFPRTAPSAGKGIVDVEAVAVPPIQPPSPSQ